MMIRRQGRHAGRSSLKLAVLAAGVALASGLRRGPLVGRGQLTRLGAAGAGELPPRLDVHARRALWRQVHEAEFELEHALLRENDDVAMGLRLDLSKLRQRDAYVVLDEQLEAALRADDLDAAREVQRLMVDVGAPPIAETKPRRPWGEAAKAARRQRKEVAAPQPDSLAGFESDGPLLLDNLSLADLLARELEARTNKPTGDEAVPRKDADTGVVRPDTTLDRWIDGLARRNLALSAKGSNEAKTTENAKKAPGAAAAGTAGRVPAPRRATLHDELRKGSIRVATSSNIATEAVGVHARALYLKKELFHRAATLPVKDASETSRKVADYLRTLKPPSPQVLADPSVYFFLFRFRVTNDKDYAVRIHEARWDIESAGGSTGEVVTPSAALPSQLLMPGESMEMSEACALQLPSGGQDVELDGVRGDLARSVFGRVSGAFLMQADEEAMMAGAPTDAFSAAIDPFYLVKKVELPW